jgi:hypothetical protein
VQAHEVRVEPQCARRLVGEGDEKHLMAEATTRRLSAEIDPARHGADMSAGSLRVNRRQRIGGAMDSSAPTRLEQLQGLARYA